MIRSIVAVMIGYAAYTLSNDFGGEILRVLIPDWVAANGRPETNAAWAASLAYSCVCCSFGCWVAAFCASHRPMRHAMALGWIGFAATTLATPFVWANFPAWYNLASVLAVLPTAYLGGWIRERQLRARPIPRAAAAPESASRLAGG